MAILLPLREKYLVNKSYKFGKYRSRTGNSNGPTPKWSGSGQGSGPRRVKGLGSVGNPLERV